LISAGLEPTNGRHQKAGCGNRRAGRRFSDEQIIEAIREAYLAKGDPFTSTILHQVARGAERARPPAAPLPADSAATAPSGARYGTWHNACLVALSGWVPVRAVEA
jgi:hypothetical protein